MVKRCLLVPCTRNGPTPRLPHASPARQRPPVVPGAGQASAPLARRRGQIPDLAKPRAATALSAPRRCGLAGGRRRRCATPGAGVRHKKNGQPQAVGAGVGGSCQRAGSGKNAGIGLAASAIVARARPAATSATWPTVLRWVERRTMARPGCRCWPRGRKDRDTTEVDRILAGHGPTRARFDFYWNRIVGADGRCSRGCARPNCRASLAGSDSARLATVGGNRPAARSFRPSRRWWKPAVNRTLAPGAAGSVYEIVEDHAAERYHRCANWRVSAIERHLFAPDRQGGSGDCRAEACFGVACGRRRPNSTTRSCPLETKERRVPAHGLAEDARPGRAQEDVCIAILRGNTRWRSTPPGRHTPVIDLYYWPTPNGHKITLFLEETDMPYTIIR